jgi:hypothetical protein
MFWTPAFAGVTIQETFYETINFRGLPKSQKSERVFGLMISACSAVVFISESPESIEATEVSGPKDKGPYEGLGKLI